MDIKLSDHFSYYRIIRYVTPSIGMMILLSAYYLVDGFFVSNWLGKIDFAAVNLLTPAIVIPSSVAFMLSAGGAAIVGKTLGQGTRDKANQYFSMMLYVVIVLGILLTFLSQGALPYLLTWMGAEDALFNAAMDYGFICILGLVPFMLQVMFQALWSVAERPQYGLYMTIGSGVINLVLDYVFIVILQWGIEGAALASIVGQIFGGFMPLLYFSMPNTSLLQLGKGPLVWSVLWKAMTNGASEMSNSISASILGILYNWQLMTFIGSDGVAAYGVILYMNGIFDCIYFGYGMGIAPIISYNYGAKFFVELKNVFSKSIVLVGLASLGLAFLAYIFTDWITYYFVGYDQDLWDLSKYAFAVYCISFVFLGYNNFGSAFFTALNNGKVSGAISVVRILVFQIGSVLLLPYLFGMNGIWWSVVVSESLGFLFVLICLMAYKKKYGY